ncbi:MAG: hypothetical protein APG12_00030 [Candidatus Methanofastidiosum methylothiophilum]|uniref:Uncharacterized protein n=1 Tax=Candidatus Methanofastidiosum methylothiophilum TaxID=1705564 RepID=A0A150IK54_9EURY|nr:MAG: hypothetical protein APG10_01001 [Candidatus Methanofastidiosum methylthiophilus]KYC48720.1 MAG: hypothetical protein APG11_00031 [Candidatus Methanofastidiosum methylthiophilus]KYC51368.1 MAG: hypothetical protein APG12_00030 [Candidatus Methanofastidiosum methylthiophilus]
MKKIMTLFIVVALIASMGIGAIAGANEDAFANAVIDEKTQFAYEKAAVEFAQGNDTEGLAAEEDAGEKLAKAKMPFRNLMGAVNSAHYVRAIRGPVPPPGTNYVPLPKGYRVVEIPGTSGNNVIVKYQHTYWDVSKGKFVLPGDVA